jgi:hypothetical protein
MRVVVERQRAGADVDRRDPFRAAAARACPASARHRDDVVVLRLVGARSRPDVDDCPGVRPDRPGGRARSCPPRARSPCVPAVRAHDMDAGGDRAPLPRSGSARPRRSALRGPARTSSSGRTQSGPARSLCRRRSGSGRRSTRCWTIVGAHFNDASGGGEDASHETKPAHMRPCESFNLERGPPRVMREVVRP